MQNKNNVSNKIKIEIEIDEMTLEELYDEFGTINNNQIFGELAESYLQEKHSINQALIEQKSKGQDSSRSLNANKPFTKGTGNNSYQSRNKNESGQKEHPIHAYQRRLNDEEDRKRRAMRGGNIGQVNPHKRTTNQASGNQGTNRRSNNYNSSSRYNKDGQR